MRNGLFTLESWACTVMRRRRMLGKAILAIFVAGTAARAADSLSPNLNLTPSFTGAPVIDPFYAGSYTATDIGAPPITAPLGGITFLDNNTLYLGAKADSASGEIDQVTVVRGADQHITGFTGAATKVANASKIDGGLQFGPSGVLFFTAYGPNTLGEFKTGSVNPDKTINLTPLGVTASVGTLCFVPTGFNGAGSIKIISWDGKTWYSGSVTADGSGTYNVTLPTSVALPDFSEGIAYIPTTAPLFPSQSILLNADILDAVYAYTIDANGNPQVASRKHFMDVNNPVGMAVDPLTQDVLIGTYQGARPAHITVVRGFHPVPGVTTTKASYAQGEAIGVNYSNAAGNAGDWIGLYAQGAANNAFLAWFYTDGTQVGSAGHINGTVTFPNGLPNGGNYEARLFFNNSFTVQATTSFTVQVSAPGQASNPNPANNATGVGVNATLTWTAGSGTTSHDVYFGTNPNPGAGEFKGNQAGASYNPGTLGLSTTYFWRIDEKNSQGTTTGIVWSFTTSASAPGVTTSKPTYNPGEAIGVNFSNAPGNAGDWIGLYAQGAPNTAYLAWFFTDGTQVGSPGFINGSVNFANGLPNPGNYEARLLLNNSYTTLATAAFTIQGVPPGKATSPSPANSATGVSLSPTLSWTAGSLTTSHKVYFGINPNPGAGELQGSQAGTTFSPGLLNVSTTYFWRIDEVNSQGTTTGDVWSFTTAATGPGLTTTKATYGLGEAIVVNFTGAGGAAGDWIGLFAQGAPNTAYLQWFYTDGTTVGSAGHINGAVTFPNGFANAGNYEARLFSDNSFNLQASVGFQVQALLPGQATTPSPAHNATGVSLSPTLTWSAGSGATSHQVYFGTNPNPGQSEFKGSQPGTSFPAGPLAGNTVYFWRIDEVNGQGTTTGVVWSFTTATPGLTTSKASYNTFETIVANFSNAQGNSSDWIGLYAQGAANNAFLDWFFTDGTKVGTAGKLNGAVNFANGLANPGNYEVRLFFNGSFTVQATASFTVQNGPPGQATNPSPAHNATGVTVAPTLTWTAGGGTSTHLVYFGTSSTLTAGDLKSTQTGTSFSPGLLAGSTTYFWRIDEMNAQGTTTGTVWSFTTTTTPPGLTTSKANYAQGEAIGVNFTNAAGNASDWIGIFAAGSPNTAYILWNYTDGTQVGSAGHVNGTVNFPAGLPNTGNYEARLFFNGSFTVQAIASFTVQAAP